MANYEADTMLQLFVFLIWNCLTQPVNMNFLFKSIFSDKAVLEQMCSAASLVFVPGLFEAIQAAQPPPISFFLSLPSDSTGIWADYAVTLFKEGEGYLIYIGSGTAVRGLRSRFNCYDKPETYWNVLPQFMRRAIKDGYKIVHRGWLVSTPVPPAAMVSKSRLLFVSGEAALSFVF